MSLSTFKPTTTRPKHNQVTWSTALQALKKRDDIFWLLSTQNFPPLLCKTLLEAAMDPGCCQRSVNNTAVIPPRLLLAVKVSTYRDH
jgi:hypothetical protein